MFAANHFLIRHRRSIAQAVLLVYVLNPLLVTAQVTINVGTANDGRRAFVDQTQSGVLKINIATSRVAGVELSSGGSAEVQALGNVTAQSLQLSATTLEAGGKALVQSKGDVELGYNTDTDQHNWTTSSTSRSWGGVQKKTTTTQHETVDKTAEVTQIEGQEVQVLG
jgi:hypothetical protein